MVKSSQLVFRHEFYLLSTITSSSIWIRNFLRPRNNAEFPIIYCMSAKPMTCFTLGPWTEFKTYLLAIILYVFLLVLVHWWSTSTIMNSLIIKLYYPGMLSKAICRISLPGTFMNIYTNIFHYAVSEHCGAFYADDKLI